VFLCEWVGGWVQVDDDGCVCCVWGMVCGSVHVCGCCGAYVNVHYMYVHHACIFINLHYRSVNMYFCFTAIVADISIVLYIDTYAQS